MISQSWAQEMRANMYCCDEDWHAHYQSGTIFSSKKIKHDGVK